MQAGFLLPFKAIVSRINSAFSSTRAALKLFEVSQTALDVLAVLAGFLFVIVTGLSIVGAFLILFFG